MLFLWFCLLPSNKTDIECCLARRQQVCPFDGSLTELEYWAHDAISPKLIQLQRSPMDSFSVFTIGLRM